MVMSPGFRAYCGAYVEAAAGRSGIIAIAARDRLQHQAAIFRRPAQRSDLVERPGKRHGAAAAHQPVGGRSPVTPQKALGVRIEPEVSEPSANVTSPAAAAIAEPLDDPPLQRVRSQGFNPGPVSEAEAKR